MLIGLIRKLFGMGYDIQKCKEYVLNILKEKKIRYELHGFDSGCSMVDIWKEEKFYVLHLEHDSVGLSLIEGVVDFSNIPDERFFDFFKFSGKLERILNDS